MKVAIVFLLAIALIACAKSAHQIVKSARPINVAQQTNEAQTMFEHSGESGTPRPANSNTGKRAATGDPIDIAKFDENIAKAEKAMKAKPDTASKSLLAEAYFE